MALKIVNNSVVEHATHLAFYENIFPQLKHLEGKGVNERFLTEGDPRSCNEIDIPRMLPIKPHYRTLGAVSNGGFKNTRNTTGGYVNDSVFYSVTLNHVFDEVVSLPYTLIASNAVDFAGAINSNITSSFAQTLNAFTWASQIYAMAQVVTADDVTVWDKTTTAAAAFTDANALLTEGDMSIGVRSVPADRRQAFISTKFNSAIKSMYSTNASDLAVQINATGFVNPYGLSEGKRVDTRTGLCGLYDGVVMTLITKAEMSDVADILGISNDTTAAKTLFDEIEGFIVYGDATIRGVAGPAIEVHDDAYAYSTKVFAPFAKFGVGVLSGKSVKVISNKAWTATDIATLKSKVSIADGLSAVGDGTNYSSQEKI